MIGVPGLPGVAPPPFAAPLEPAKPVVDRHDPFGTAAASVAAEGAIDVERVVLSERQLGDLTTLKEQKRQYAFYATLAAGGLVVGAMFGYFLGDMWARQKVIDASHAHARKIHMGLEKAHVAKVKEFIDKLGQQRKNIADAASSRDPELILQTVSADVADLEALRVKDVEKAEDLIGESLVVGNLSAFANESIGPVLRAIALWNRLNAQIKNHVAVTNQQLGVYAFQLAALAEAGFEKEYKCRNYLESHRGDANPDEKVRKRMTWCQEVLQKMQAAPKDLSGLISVAITAYQASQELGPAMQADFRKYFDSLRQRLGAGPEQREAIAQYLGACRFAVVFDRGFFGSLAGGEWVVDLSKYARLYTLGQVKVLEAPLPQTDLGIPAPEAPAEGGEAPPAPEAKNMLSAFVGGAGTGQPELEKFLFVVNPGTGSPWNDLNSDNRFDQADIDLFWESFKAHPDLWAIAVDPAPALGLADALNSQFLIDYQQRLIELGDTANEIQTAVKEAIKKMGIIHG